MEGCPKSYNFIANLQCHCRGDHNIKYRDNRYPSMKDYITKVRVMDFPPQVEFTEQLPLYKPSTNAWLIGGRSPASKPVNEPSPVDERG